jgi:MGT family glycosyltransferase
MTKSKLDGTILPLTTAQSGLWLAHKLKPQVAFNLVEALEIHGAIDADLLMKALRRTVLEQDTLRVSFLEGPAGPGQVIGPDYNGTLSFQDFSAAPDARNAAWLWMEDDATRARDLLVGPLCSAAIIKVAPDSFFFYNNAPHIQCDGYSGMLLVHRLAELYAALFEQREPDPDTELTSFTVLIKEEGAYRQSERFRRDREYWIGRFVDLPPALTLASVTADDRKPASGDGVLRQRRRLTAETVAALRARAQKAGSSLPQLLIALVTAYLYRATGQADLVVGLPVIARTTRATRKAGGLAANIVPLRLAMAPDMTIDALLQQVSREVRQCLRHQQYPYEDLRRDLALARNNQRLFTTVVNIEPFDYDLRFGEHSVTPENLSNGGGEDLGIFLYDRGTSEGIVIDFDANPAKYDVESLAAHQQRLLRLIHSAIDNPDQRLGQIDILDPDERQQILAELSGCDRPIQPTLFPAMFEAQVARRPTATALIHNGNSFSYADLNTCANRLAHHLIGHGNGPGSVVAVALPRSSEAVIATLAVLKVGATYLPIDPTYPIRRIAMMLTDARPTCIVAESPLRQAGDTWCILLGTKEAQAELLLQPTHNPTDVDRTRPLDVGDAAYLIYTSGSSGIPKGVVVPHAGIASLAEEQIERFEITPDSRILQFASASFDASIMELLMAFAPGATLVVPEPGPLVGDRLALELRKHEISHALIPPAALASLPPGHFSYLRTLVVGGDACPPDLVQRWSKDRSMINAYGPTETTIVATLSEPLCGRVVPPIGRSIRNTKVYVLDAGLQPVPIGVLGELYVAGPCLAHGYLNLPDLTAEHFIANPFGAPGSRMYRTGDLVRWNADGSLVFLGRLDHQVKIRGFRVEPGEIETTLTSVDDISQAAVIAREDQNGEKSLAAYVVPKPGATLDLVALRQEMARRLPHYMVPATFTVLETLPITANGKLHRSALPKPGLQYAKRYVAPRTSTEATLAAIWAEALDLERVGVEDNFFELGGHSLLVARLIARVKTEFSVDLPLAVVFEASTIAGLAAKIDQARSSKLPTTAPNLAADVELDAHIQPQATLPPRHATEVFLTGATGYVGSHLLGALLRDTDARINCLVRALTPQVARIRLRRSFTERGLIELWDDNRIGVLPGDLSEPELGLDENGIAIVRDQCEAIYHCAATVDFLLPYSALKPANVNSVRRLIDWTAEGRSKSLHFVSTLSVIDPTDNSDEITENAPLKSWNGLIGGYSQSKWAADTLMREALSRGLPVAIYRLGAITGDRRHAICNATDMIWRVVRASVRLGAILDVHMAMTPVDDIADAMLRLSRSDRPWGGIYHLVSQGTVHLRDMAPIFTRMGIDLQYLPFGPWLERASLALGAHEDNDLSTVVSILDQYDPTIVPPSLSCDITQARMREIGSPIPPVGSDLLERYLLNLGIGATTKGSGGRSARLDSRDHRGRGQQRIEQPKNTRRRARFLFGATAVPGHVSPLVAIAEHLVGSGHEVVVHTGSLFRDNVEATGARFVPLRTSIDHDYRRLGDLAPELRQIPLGPELLRLTMKRLHSDIMGDQAAGLRDILRDFPADAIVVDTMFCGMLPILLDRRQPRPPLVGVGVTALGLSSVDTAFFTSGVAPSSTPEGRGRNIAMHRNMRALHAGMQRDFNETLTALGCLKLPGLLFDALCTLPDLYLQLTAESFEYPRSDLPETIRFVGPLLAPSTREFTPPDWWADIDADRPVVLVTQGTMANEDLGQLIGPTLTGLANEEVLIVATTGGRPIEAIPVDLPHNARATSFVPFDRLLPKVDVLVTNGGYGSVNLAISLGVPIVVAGATEEKPEIAARVAWSGAGLNLGTGQPLPHQVRDAVRTILSDPRYRLRAQALQADFARHDARREIAAILDDLVSGQELRASA